MVVGQTTVQPGQSTTLYTDFAMHEGMGGKHLFEIALKTNDPTRSAKTLQIRSNWIPSASPLYEQMKIDIDARHPAQSVPAERPSAARGALLNLTISENLRTVSPSEVFSELRGDSIFKSYSDQQLWDVIAFAYRQTTGKDAVARGQKLYTRDCASCHGESGKGNGAAGLNLPGLTAIPPDTAEAKSNVKQGPADFTDGSQMLGASDVLWQGKIQRGGMGTGMPGWGSLYTEQEIWDVISYIRSFTFDYAAEEQPGSK